MKQMNVSRIKAKYRSDNLPFKPRARLLLLLGDQLIRDAGIAVFELVKNGYDADASEVTILMHNTSEPEEGSIIIEDNGTGMDWNTVTNVWLEPGTDYRSRQRESGYRTSKFHRLPLGEKGVGRFAAHKLGRKIQLVTKRAGKPEVVVNIDWIEFEGKQYLNDVKVSVKEREPVLFKKGKTGTSLEIRNLRDGWTRGMVRNLHRAVMSIRSPFEGPEEFHPQLILDPDEGWLNDLLDVTQALKLSLFRAACWMDKQKLSYKYSFTPPPGMDRVEGRKKKIINMDMPAECNLEGKNEDLLRIGKVKIDLHIFDRERQVLAFGISDVKGLRYFLDTNGGIRVYRDGVRVYDFGEPGNDWLELGGRRVNVPVKRISNNLVIGAVSLNLNESRDLIEKTNREGFVENEAYSVFKDAVFFAVKQIEWERNIDKERIRTAYSKQPKELVMEELQTLRNEIEKRNLGVELSPYIDRIESQFLEVRDRLLTAAGSGLSLAVVIHEVEKGVAELNKAVEREVSIDKIKNLANHLSELIEGLTFLMRRSGMRKESASTLIKHAIFNTEYRLKYHNIEIANGMLKGDPDFSVKCSRRLIIATLMNLIDNSIYWLDTKGGHNKRIYIGTAYYQDDYPAMVVADNGPGFIDPPEYLVQPFVSRKPDGMGLGLHLANEVMKAHDGRLEFPEEDETDLTKGFKGAVVALVFRKEK